MFYKNGKIAMQLPPLMFAQTQTTLPIMGRHQHTMTFYKLSCIVIIAVLVTLVLNTEALVTWTQNLPVNPVSDKLFEAAQKWHDLMDELGLTIVFDKLREAFRFFQEL
jgi:hypothetical protein